MEIAVTDKCLKKIIMSSEAYEYMHEENVYCVDNVVQNNSIITTNTLTKINMEDERFTYPTLQSACIDQTLDTVPIENITLIYNTSTEAIHVTLKEYLNNFDTYNNSSGSVMLLPQDSTIYMKQQSCIIEGNHVSTELHPSVFTFPSGVSLKVEKFIHSDVVLVIATSTGVTTQLLVENENVYGNQRQKTFPIKHIRGSPDFAYHPDNTITIFQIPVHILRKETPDMAYNGVFSAVNEQFYSLKNCTLKRNGDYPITGVVHFNQTIPRNYIIQREDMRCITEALNKDLTKRIHCGTDITFYIPSFDEEEVSQDMKHMLSYFIPSAIIMLLSFVIVSASTILS